jgi:protease II
MRLTLTLLVQLLFSFSIFAQTQITLKGKVIDSKNQEPLAFSYVTIAGVALGTVTNGEGEFTLNFPTTHQDKNIVFSYIGYARKTYAITDLLKMNPLVVSLEVDVTQIKEVVIQARKKISAKQLLKKVMNNLEQNYSQTPVYLDGYYRETIAENGAFISYADAVVKIHYAPYQEKSYKWSDYRNESQSAIFSLNNANIYNGRNLHRGHFHSLTMNKDQAKVIDSRSSKNLTKTDMKANIQAGPMGIFSKDYLKYKAAFFDDNKLKKFNFELGEVLMKGVGYVYVLSFKTELTRELMEKLEKKGTLRPFYKASRNKVLQGKIYIDKDDYAVLKFESIVPSAFKKYFCSYTSMNYKHFDYKLNIEYQKIGNKYHLKSLRHEDEFILNDTITNNITPYYAVSQFWVNDVKTEQVALFKETEVFANSPTNQLFDLPLEYHEGFWNDYTAKNPLSIIPDSIRKDMETNMPLEKQFSDKHNRNDSLQAPIAKIIPTKTTIHKTTLVDDYAWLKQPKNPLQNPDIKEYIVAENEFMDNYFIPLRKSQRELFTELTSRLDKEDESIPYEKDGYWYQTRWTEDDEYPFYLRRKNGINTWDTLMNVNALAKDKDYYSAGGISVSPNTSMMLYYENTTGSDKSIVKFKDIKSGLITKDSMLNVSEIIWLNDHQLLYTVQEQKTNRIYQLKLHELNTPQESDSLLFQENDFRFQVSVWKSKSKEYIYLNVGSSNTNEVYFMNLKTTEKGFHLMMPREEKHEYSVSDYQNEFYIISNKESADREVFKCNEKAYTKADWKKFLKPEKGSRLTAFLIFDDFIVIGESENMENRLKIIDKESNKSHYLKIKEDVHLVFTEYNPNYHSDTLQYSFSSMKTPDQVWNYNMRTKEQRLVKEQEVKNYLNYGWIKNKLVWAEARDGTMIPITLLYPPYAVHKNNKHKRMFITSYGSYGSGSESGFNSSIYSLLSRGFVYAIPHVRGGGELGQKWHDGGKMMHKRNTFTDFIDCTEFLIAEGYAQKGNIVAEGGSAGGLLMGGIVNMRPDLFKLVILDVPFVDVINTMLDDKLPLTTLEYEEWGNPNKKKEFEYMLSYSPYENVKAQDYPHMIFTTGVNDTRVGYWEPAKMVAKLRQLKTDNNLLFLKTDLSGGHGGGSGRFDGYKELAYKYAVIFDVFASDILAEIAEKAAAEKANNGK